MPSTYAHRRFGANVLEHLPDELRAQLEQNRELYDIGLHGPEQFTRESGVTHCEIETEFDNMLLRRDGYDPLKFFTASHIHPSEKNAGIIAPFYEGISEQTALEALKGMISVHRLLQASNPVKRWVVLTGMKVVGKYDMLHGLVANPQPNPKCVKSGKQLEALYAKALPLAETLILEFMAKLDTGEPLDKAYDHTFGEF